MSIAPQMPAANIPLPAGAVFGDVWEDGHRVVFGANRGTDHLVVEATTLQRTDGTIAERGRRDGRPIDAPHLVVHDDTGSVIRVYLDQAAGLIAGLAEVVGDLERWIDETADAGDHTARQVRYTLLEATQLLLGENHGLRNPQLWVARRLRSGEFTGQRIGRQWFMRPADIEAAQDAMASKLKPQPALEPEPEPMPAPLIVIDGLSARSRNRLMRSAGA
ncbi:hypothetical protein [Mycobacterium sp. Aquia_213]|uniref:hypothetical protein n=1 Tax=Mycobacterium sp. Aquia_213 TaxID=2991728 RepID=UPI002270C23F|nr:hypothetical protein [Mycobacterium sp. Aquia_213]WAC89706.1 hypothetical protein LMQ14_17310 [Mycobacterium sp. Aquia_213]